MESTAADPPGPVSSGPRPARTTATATAPQRRRVRAPDTLYFSYGSNCHLAQMATRCPESVFRGKATLAGYRWQINERGVANIVKSTPDSVVEGLLFAIRPKDERALDRSEGVSRGFYQKHLLRFKYEPHPQYRGLKTVHVDQLLEGQPGGGETDTASPAASLMEAGATFFGFRRQDSSPVETRRPPAPEKVKALVYVSENYTTDGQIRDEYITRMQNAIAHAVLLGVSPTWVEKTIGPHLKRESRAQATPRAPAPTQVSEPESAPTQGGDDPMQVDTESSGHDHMQAGTEGSNRVQRQIDIEDATGSSERGQRQADTADSGRDSGTGVDTPPEDDDDNALYEEEDAKTGREERRPPNECVIEFPEEVVEDIHKKTIRVATDEEVIYIVVTVHGEAGFAITGSTHSLSLANDLAMASFKDACSYFARPETEEEEEATRDMGVDEEACLRLCGTDPGTKRQVRVWVERQILL